MPGRNFRRKLMRARLYKTVGISRKKAIRLFLPLIFIITGCMIIIVRVSPMIMDIAMSVVTDVMRDTANEAITEVMSSGEYDYSKLITLEKGENGNITALVTNIEKINVFQTEVASKVLDNINGLDDVIIKIPIGSITGISILSGRGPSIKIKLLTMSSVNTSFSNAFTSAGINQTRHQILMDVSVDVGVILPTGTSSETVSVEVVIAETVIVGTVPETYADFK